MVITIVRCSAAVYREVANTILPTSIKMKEDTAGNHPSHRIPILDTEMAVEGNQIVHYHYSKPMSSLEVTMEKSAMSMSAKINILTQEGSRRLRNCSLQIPWDTKVRYLNKLMVQMYWGGYSQNTRELVATRILARFENNLFNYHHLGRPLHRSKSERRSEPKADKASWYRGDGTTTTITIPATAGSKLARAVRDTLLRVTGPTGTKVKVIERPGPKYPKNI